MKYCGVATPFRGVRVYTRSPMGMPGSETALEELMCRVLGQSGETICWTDVLRTSFSDAQRALLSRHTITLPKPEDQLWIITDGVFRKPGIGTTLYITRNDKL